jgi:ABC-type phosphate transport system substrate-binding protein
VLRGLPDLVFGVMRTTSAALVLLAGGAYAQTPYVDGLTQVINVHGSGTTNPQRLFWEAMDLLEGRSKLPLTMTYRGVGSGVGQAEFVGDANSNFTSYNHFGSGDIPMTSALYNTVRSKGREMLHVPFALGAISVFHNVPEAELGGATIDLDACMLAKIFTRQITSWDHPDIKALNPEMTARGEIKVHRRADDSSSSSGITQYLKGKCPASWVNATGAAYSTGSVFPSVPGTISVQGSQGMADAIDATPNAIGYMDAGHGHEKGFAEIALKNRDGVYLTSKNANIGAAALAVLAANAFPVNATLDFSAVNLYDQAGPTTWPIVLISYFYLDRNLTSMDALSASVLDYFVKFILSPEGQALAETNWFSKLPAQLNNFSTQALALIQQPAGFITFTTELAAETKQYVGARTHVFSGKRQSWPNYETNVLTDRLTALEAKVAVHDHDDHDEMNCISTWCFTGQRLAGIAVASILIACFSLFIGLIGLCLGLVVYCKNARPRLSEPGMELSTATKNARM